MSGEFADAGSIKASIDFDAAGLQAAVERAMKSAVPIVTDAVDGAAAQVEQRMTDRFKNAGKVALGALGIGGVVDTAVRVGGYIMSVGRDTERALNMFQAVSKATGAEMDVVAEKAQALGSDAALAGVSAGDAALAMTELAKSGFSVEESMSASTGVLQLATAAQTDAANAAKIASAQIQSFGLEASDAAMVADVLANAANITSADMDGMADSLNQVGAVAKASGLSFAETAGTVALMADNAIIGSDAGTSLKSMLLAIQAPSDKAADLMAQYGINMYDANGNMLSLAGMTRELSDGMSGLTEQQRQAALATIFGADAIRTVNVLMNEGAPAVKELTEAVQEQGAAAALADANTQGFTGALDALRNIADGLAGDIYQNVAPAMEDWLRGVLADLPRHIDAATSYVSEFIDALRPAARVVAAFIEAADDGAVLAFKAALGAVLAVAKTLGIVLGPIADFMEANEDAMGGIVSAAVAVVLGYKAMTLAVRNFNRVMSSRAIQNTRTHMVGLRDSMRSASTAATALRVTGSGMIAAMGGGWGIAIAAATLAFGKFAAEQAAAKAEVAEFSGTLDEQTQAFTDNTRAAVARRLVEEDGWDTDRLDQYGVTLAEVTGAVLQGGDALEALQAKMASKEGSNIFSGWFGDIPGLTDHVSDFNSRLDEMSGHLHRAQANEALLARESRNGAAALEYLLDPMARTEDASAGVADGFSDTGRAADAARRAVWALQNQFIKGLSAEIEYEQAIDDLAGKVKEVGREALTTSGKLAIGRQKGRELANALIAVAGSADGAKGGIKRARTEMVRILTPLTGSKAKAKALAAEFFVLKGGADRAGGAMRGAGNDAKGAAGKIQHLGDVAKTVDGQTVRVSVQTPGLAGSLSSINSFIARIDSANSRSVSVPFVSRGGTVRRASGGPIFGGGTGTSDDVEVLASTGEHMWTAREVDAAGGHGAVETLRRAVLGGGLGSLAAAADASDGAPLVGSLSLAVGSKDDLPEGLNETLFHLRRIKRGSRR